MRISDWSSDVCSSDLHRAHVWCIACDRPLCIAEIAHAVGDDAGLCPRLLAQPRDGGEAIIVFVVMWIEAAGRTAGSAARLAHDLLAVPDHWIDQADRQTKAAGPRGAPHHPRRVERGSGTQGVRTRRARWSRSS